MIVVACSTPAKEPLQLDGNLLTIDNRTSSDWNDVEVWLNRQFRVTASKIPAGARFQAPLDTFIEAYGQRFSFKRMQIRDLRLKATLPDGSPLELKKEFAAGGLAGALGGKR